MTKPNILSICLLATLLAPLAGCQIPPRQGVEPARDGGTPAHANAAQAPAAEAQAPARKASARDEVPVRDRHRAGGAAFSDSDIADIRDFYQQGHQPVTPPGKITKLNRGGPYPFGYTWRALPSELENRLSSLPKGYSRILVGNDIGLLDIRTRIVVDLVENLYSEAQAPVHKVQAAERKTPAPERKVQAAETKIQASVQKVQATETKLQASVQKVQAPDRRDEADAAFSEDDMASIHDFYQQGHQPGLTAGRITKLRQGEAYPFGYTWRALPRDLEARLSPLPNGYIRVLVGTDIGILDIRTRVVVDILENLAA